MCGCKVVGARFVPSSLFITISKTLRGSKKFRFVWYRVCDFEVPVQYKLQQVMSKFAYVLKMRRIL